MKRGRALFVESALPRTSSRKNFNVIESLFEILLSIVGKRG